MWMEAAADGGQNMQILSQMSPDIKINLSKEKKATEICDTVL